MSEANGWEGELALLTAILRKTDLEETIKWGMPVFTYKRRNVVGIAGFKCHFTLWFYNGVFLSDKAHVLTNAQEGKTKSLRQWRFTSHNEIDEPLILSYINEAIDNEKQGKVLKPEAKGRLPIPLPLKNALEEDEPLKQSFEKLSLYKQNEYVEYITAAKQETTKISRIDKIRPLILQGIGLHDKYKPHK